MTNPRSILDAAQSERVIVTRYGKPSAVLLGIEYKDEEDLALEEFWRMIEERRKEKTSYSLQEVKERFGMTSRKGRSPTRPRKKRKP